MNGKWVDFEIRKETIKVAGGDAVDITVRSTRHGPVISDTYGPLEDQGEPQDKRIWNPFKERNGGEDLPEGTDCPRLDGVNPLHRSKRSGASIRHKTGSEFREAAAWTSMPAQNLAVCRH